MADMPDFDKMTPEEMMRWMESLAKRQGATEGLITSADADVPEVDANDERLKGVGEYIPHGWTREQWEAQLAKEAAQKASKAAAAPPPPTPKPAPTPVQAAPPLPAAAKPVTSSPAMLDPSKMSEAEIMAALETMSPDDMMRFMEKLAKRQGATEGIINQDIDASDLPEIDESDARLAGQKRYIPHGLTKEQEAKWLAEEEERERRLREQRATPPTARPAAPPPAPVSSPPGLDDLLKPPSLDDLFSKDILPSLRDDDEPTAPVVEVPPAVVDPMDWLAGLADDSTTASLDLGNLSDLGAGLGQLAQFEQPASDPMDWLAGLAGDPMPKPATPQPAVDSFQADAAFGGDIDPIAFMETLASQHGAPPEELVTSERLDIKRPSSFSNEDPGYQPYSFEEDTELPPAPSFAAPVADLGPLDDPEAWLDQLASSANVGRSPAEEITVDDVMTALNQGKDVPPDLVDAFFQKQFERAAQIDDDEGLSFFELAPSDSELPPIEANIPDWLKEQFGGPPPELAAAIGTDPDAFFADLGLDEPAAPVAAQGDMPAWLTEELGGDPSSDTPVAAPIDFFAEEDEPEPVSTPASTLRFDVDDPLVIALTQEAEDQAQLERWYSSRLRSLNEGKQLAPQGLAEAELPVETQLQAGEAQAMPDWLSGDQALQEELPEAIQAIPDWLQSQSAEALPDWLASSTDESIAISDEEALPDWLAAADVNIAPDDIPDWLRETIVEEEQPIVPSSSAPIVEIPAPAPPAPKPVVEASPAAPTPLTPISAPRSPVPTPQRARIDVAATLERARANLRQDTAASLQDYEAIVRANEALDVVVADLSKLTEDKDQKKNPAVYRVLGDALMRRGNLQEALATYRRALNLL
ncbi:MAG: tetratricopeptide repeat protein [Anaerolineae bacterium]|nr:tetratricopeptide repeat protein [Anaerolineae bacterium]MDW8172744.1 tetratricopeptide repeat protein [Anaerolineae bacterium]